MKDVLCPACGLQAECIADMWICQEHGYINIKNTIEDRLDFEASKSVIELYGSEYVEVQAKGGHKIIKILGVLGNEIIARDVKPNGTVGSLCVVTPGLLKSYTMVTPKNTVTEEFVALEIQPTHYKYRTDGTVIYNAEYVYGTIKKTIRTEWAVLK